jgi:hypothetical protein
MTHLVDELRDEAEEAIEAMRAAALAARSAHARAELVRHMATTAAKVRNLPREQAVDTIVGEWMKAWHLAKDAYPEIAGEMRAFTDAICSFTERATAETDSKLRSAVAALDAALSRSGTTLADQMAWRSECAHGWWMLVVPMPDDLPGRAERAGIPRPEDGRPFWEAACAPHCRG